MALIDNEGVDALTTPHLAGRVGVGTMSLYRHIDDKDDLVKAVVERVLSGVSVPDDWQSRVVGYLRALRDQAIARPALSRILASRGLTVGPVFDQLEQTHTSLLAAGFPPTDAVRTFYTLLTNLRNAGVPSGASSPVRGTGRGALQQRGLLTGVRGSRAARSNSTPGLLQAAQFLERVATRAGEQSVAVTVVSWRSVR